VETHVFDVTRLVETDQVLGVGFGIGSGFVMSETSDAVLAWADGDSAYGVADVVGREGKIDEGMA